MPIAIESHTTPPTKAIPCPINLLKWIDEHRAEFVPPVMNKQFYDESSDSVVFVSVGPNTRNDYHVNPTEELFYQLRGDIAVRVRPLDGSEPYNQIIREGEIWLCPRWVPHRPQRPPNTIGLIIEFPRRHEDGKEYNDGLRWYCPECDHLVHEASFPLGRIDKDLHKVMDNFWDGPESGRTCEKCGYVIQRAPEFQMPEHVEA